MNKEQELRPCPWCNGAAQPPIYSLGRWFCRCTKCGTSGPSFSHGGPHAGEAEISAAKDQAIAAWNRRSSDEQAEVVGWRARRWGSSKWELFAYDPRSLKQFSFFEPVYASPPAVAAGGVTEAMVEMAMSAYWGTSPGSRRTARDRMVDALLAALAVGDEGIREGAKDTVDYVMRYGGRCRDCADENGTCPHSGLPCDTDAASKVIGFVLRAVDYGQRHGYLPAKDTTHAE